jgi:hypothetical protein
MYSSGILSLPKVVRNANFSQKFDTEYQWPTILMAIIMTINNKPRTQTSSKGDLTTLLVEANGGF